MLLIIVINNICFLAVQLTQVLISPVFKKKLAPSFNMSDGSVLLECQVSGYPRPEITWFKESKIIQQSEVYEMHYNEENFASLTIRDATNEGTYTVVAKNQAGYAACSTEIYVDGNHLLINCKI